MDTSVVLFVINGLMGAVMWFMKNTLVDLKEQLKEQRLELNSVRDNSFKKSDFYEFKQDLWLRLDEMKLDFQRALDKK